MDYICDTKKVTHICILAFAYMLLPLVRMEHHRGLKDKNLGGEFEFYRRIHTNTAEWKNCGT